MSVQLGKRVIHKFLATGLLTLGLDGCSSNPHKAEEIDTKIDNKGQITGDTSLGLKEGNMVVQKKVMSFSR